MFHPCQLVCKILGTWKWLRYSPSLWETNFSYVITTYGMNFCVNCLPKALSVSSEINKEVRAAEGREGVAARVHTVSDLVIKEQCACMTHSQLKSVTKHEKPRFVDSLSPRQPMTSCCPEQFPCGIPLSLFLAKWHSSPHTHMPIKSHYNLVIKTQITQINMKKGSKHIFFKKKI